MRERNCPLRRERAARDSLRFRRRFYDELRRGRLGAVLYSNINFFHFFFTYLFPPSTAVSAWAYVLLYHYGRPATRLAEARWSNGRWRGARASPGLVPQHKALHVAAARGTWLQAPAAQQQQRGRSTGTPRLFPGKSCFPICKSGAKYLCPLHGLLSCPFVRTVTIPK